jgi:hypothetical protein
MSYLFNSTGGGIYCNSGATGIDVQSASVSISVWLYTASIPASADIVFAGPNGFTSGTNSVGGLSFYTASGGLAGRTKDGGSGSDSLCSTTTAVATSTWVNVIYTSRYDAGSAYARAFKNGTAIAAEASGRTTPICTSQTSRSIRSC